MAPNPPTDSAIERGARVLADHFGIEYGPDQEMYDDRYWNELARRCLSASYPQRDEGEGEQEWKRAWKMRLAEYKAAQARVRELETLARLLIAPLDLYEPDRWIQTTKMVPLPDGLLLRARSALAGHQEPPEDIPCGCP